MDSSEKGFSAPKNSPNPSFCGESNENDVRYNQMDSNSKSQNPKKFVVKNFMSPTVSAKSKVTAPRKKIFGDKNEAFTFFESSHVSKIPVPDSRNGPRHSGPDTTGCHQILTPAISACRYTSKSDGEDASDFSADSSLKPYDPLTNYLSPRPKYLRYKPNRRHEVFLSRNLGEKDNSFLHARGSLNSQNQEFIGEETASEFDQKPLTSYPPEFPSEMITMAEVEKENEHVGEFTDDEEEDEEEDEEFVEKKGWSLMKGMVKFLLLFVVITLSVSYISSMNDPTPSPIVEAVGVLGDGFYRMHRCLFEAVFTNVDDVAWVNRSGLSIGDAQTGFLEVSKPFVSQMIVQMVEPCDELIEDISAEDDEIEDDLIWLDSEIAEYEEDDVGKEPDKSPGWDSANSDAASDKEYNVGDNSEGQHWPAALDDVQSPFIIENDDNQISEGNHLENDQNTDEYDEGSFGEKKSKQMAEPEIETLSSADTISLEGEVEDEVSAVKSRVNLLETEWLTSETAAASWVEDVVFLSALTDNKELDVGGPDRELKSMKDTKFMELGPISIAAIWFSFLSIILASLSWIYSSRAKQAPPPPPENSLHEVSERKEELILAQPSPEFEHKQEEKAESVAKPSSYYGYSLEETTKEEHTHIQAPSVELLGEFVIGEHSSSLSLRSCGRKGWIETEEESINPISHAGHVVESRTQPAVVQVPLLNASKTDSCSYGSFTAEKIVRRKEAGRDREAKLFTTPVRRSSRIRNLSITSP